MLRNCIVPGCSSGRETLGHKFPTNPAQCLKWKDAVKSPRLEGLPLEEICLKYVCYRHFGEECYSDTMHNRKLKPNSVPTLYLPVDQVIDKLGESYCIQRV